MIILIFNSMNIYLFWILFLALWAIVPLMIIKGRVDEEPKIQTSPKVKAKKKGWFNQLISSPTFNTFSSQIIGILVVFIWNYAASSKVVWNN